MKPAKILILILALTTRSVSIIAQNPTDFDLLSATDKSHFKLNATRGKYVALHFLLKTECPYCIRYTNDYMSKASTLPDVIQVFIKPDSDEEIASWAKKLSSFRENASHTVLTHKMNNLDYKTFIIEIQGETEKPYE